MKFILIVYFFKISVKGVKPLRLSEVEDILICYNKDNKLSKFGFFPAIAWFNDRVLNLEKRFEELTVKSKRNHADPVKRRTKTFTEAKMCIGIITLVLLQVERFSNIHDKFSDETELAEMIGLKRFFSDQTAYNFINNFSKWHTDQLKKINKQLLIDFGQSTKQEMPIIDIDMTTFSLESKKREGAIPGYNKIKRGKPCYQWSAAFCDGEVIAHVLDEGNTVSRTNFDQVLEESLDCLGKDIALIRLDSGYISAEVLNYMTGKNLFTLCGCPYKWVMGQIENKGIVVEWDEYNDNTWLFDLGITSVVKNAKDKYRVILVKKEQEEINIKASEKYLFYAIVTNFFLTQSKEIIYREYHGRQTIENFFKEVKNPFKSTKIPSGRMRGNHAYLWLVSISYNCYMIFKKTVCRMTGKSIHLKQFAINS